MPVGVEGQGLGRGEILQGKDNGEQLRGAVGVVARK